MNPKEARVTTIISDKVDFKANTVTTDEDDFIVIKGLIKRT